LPGKQLEIALEIVPGAKKIVSCPTLLTRRKRFHDETQRQALPHW
jgi:hypothetical protein